MEITLPILRTHKYHILKRDVQKNQELFNSSALAERSHAILFSETTDRLISSAVSDTEEWSEMGKNL